MLSTFAHLVPVGFGEALSVALAVVTWVALALTYHRGWQRSPRPRPGRLASFLTGTALVLIVVSPPLEHLAEDLVSVHMVQHIVMLLVGTPLIVVSRPMDNLLRGLPRRGRKFIGSRRIDLGLTPARTGRIVRPALVWLVYGVAIWFWHGAVPYEMAVRNVWVHLFEHVVFLIAGLAFWSMVLVARPTGVSAGFRVLMVFTTAFHSVLLGALITFSDTVWYAGYVPTTLAMGLDPLADQRLAGLLMWIPGGLIYTGTALWILASLLQSQHEEAPGHVGAETASG